jgi:hypothetical protein
MQQIKQISGRACGMVVLALAVGVCVGFELFVNRAVAAGAATSQPVAIRINAGATTRTTDNAGNVWEADKGFADGDTVEREADVKITNTADPFIYRTEHFGMTSFSVPVANGKYTVKLHFAETSATITSAGTRVFSVNVEGHELKDIDVWKKTGGRERAYVETVPVEVTNGKLEIKFTASEQKPEINGIEILPVP